MSTVLSIYESWLDRTQNPTAAATLVLAEVLTKSLAKRPHANDAVSSLAEVQADRRAASRGTENPMLRPRDVASQLTVSPSTVIAWIRRGELKGSNLAQPGKRPRWAIAKGAVDDFLKKRQPEKTTVMSKRSRGDSRKFY